MKIAQCVLSEQFHYGSMCTGQNIGGKDRHRSKRDTIDMEEICTISYILGDGNQAKFYISVICNFHFHFPIGLSFYF